MSRITRVVFAIAFAAAVGPLAAQIHPEFKSRQVKVSSFAVIPPQVSGTGRGLKADEVSDRAEGLATEIGELLEGVLTERAGAGNVVGYSQESLGGQEARAINAAQSAYDSLTAKLYSKPKDIEKGAFTLGEGVRELSKAVNEDILVFARATAKFGDDTQTSVGPNSISFSITRTSDVRARFSFVDARTGAVVFFFEAKGKGNKSQTEEGLRSGIEKALLGLASLGILSTSAPNTAPAGSTPSAAAAAQAKTLTNEEKLKTWQGEKITLLPTTPLGCPGGEAAFLARLFTPVTPAAAPKGGPVRQYAGRTGTILDAKSADYQNEIIIQLEDGERVRARDDMGLAFHAELDAARKLVGASLWSKGQQTVKLAENRCEDSYPAKPRLTLRNLQKLTVTNVSFGSHLQKLLITVKTEDGREAILDGWNGYDYLEERFHLTGVSGVGVKPFSARFYFEDPRPPRK